MKRGDCVIINTPENVRLHNTGATILRHVPDADYYLLDAPAAATGCFRALEHEIELIPPAERNLRELSGVPRKGMIFTGDICTRCGGSNVVQTGTCRTCQDCGENSGGCS
jgi:hypothetical protein